MGPQNVIILASILQMLMVTDGYPTLVREVAGSKGQLASPSLEMIAGSNESAMTLSNVWIGTANGGKIMISSDTMINQGPFILGGTLGAVVLFHTPRCNRAITGYPWLGILGMADFELKTCQRYYLPEF